MQSIQTNELESSLLDTIKGSELTEIPGDLIDAFAEFPIASTLSKLSKGVFGIRDYLFAKKVVGLVAQVAMMSKTKREHAIATLLANPEDRQRFSESLLLSLDKLDDVRKASILGNLVLGLMREEISLPEYRRMSRAVEAISLDEEWPVLLVVAEYKDRFYTNSDERDSKWTHEGVLLEMVNAQLGTSYSDGDLIVVSTAYQIVCAHGLILPCARVKKEPTCSQDFISCDHFNSSKTLYTTCVD